MGDEPTCPRMTSEPRHLQRPVDEPTFSVLGFGLHEWALLGRGSTPAWWSLPPTAISSACPPCHAGPLWGLAAGVSLVLCWDLSGSTGRGGVRGGPSPGLQIPLPLGRPSLPHIWEDGAHDVAAAPSSRGLAQASTPLGTHPNPGSGRDPLPSSQRPGWDRELDPHRQVNRRKRRTVPRSSMAWEPSLGTKAQRGAEAAAHVLGCPLWTRAAGAGGGVGGQLGRSGWEPEEMEGSDLQVCRSPSGP